MAAKVQAAPEEDPLKGNVFVSRGRRAGLDKLLWWTADGLCLLASGWNGGASPGHKIPAV